MRQVRRRPRQAEGVDERSPDTLVPTTLPGSRWSRPSPRRTALVVLPLLVGVVIAGLHGGRLLWGEPDEPELAAGGVTCWDGTETAAYSDCTAPRGVEGLAWVFPSFRPGELDCVDEIERNPRLNRPVMHTCEARIGGRPVRISYSEVTGFRPALRFLDDLHGQDRRSAGTLDDVQVVRWAASPTSDGGWTASVMLKSLPYAVTVRTTRRSDAEKVLRRRVDVREPAALGALAR